MRKLSISLKIELALVICLIISLISSIINKTYWYTQILAGIVLLLMGYNNHKYFKKRNMTYVYTIAGALVIVVSVYRLIRG